MTRDASFREQLERDFGAGLVAGAGRLTSVDPLELLDRDPHDAALTSLTIVRIIDQAPQRPWKLFELAWDRKHGSDVLRMSTDCAQIENGERSFRARAFYFVHPRLSKGGIGHGQCPA